MTTTTEYHAGPVLETLRGILAELSMRYEVETQPQRPKEELPKISTPGDVQGLVGPEMAGLAQEQLRVLLLDTRGWVVGQRVVYQGTISEIPVRPAEILRPAVIENAPRVILVHNHPSGACDPSPEDVLITRKIRDAGELLGIEVEDHVIIGGDGHFSMKEKGVGF